MSQACKIAALSFLLGNKDKSGALAARAPVGFTHLHLLNQRLVPEEGRQLHWQHLFVNLPSSRYHQRAWRRPAAFKGSTGGSYWCLALLTVWLPPASTPVWAPERFCRGASWWQFSPVTELAGGRCQCHANSNSLCDRFKTNLPDC